MPKSKTLIPEKDVSDWAKNNWRQVVVETHKGFSLRLWVNSQGGCLVTHGRYRLYLGYSMASALKTWEEGGGMTSIQIDLKNVGFWWGWGRICRAIFDGSLQSRHCFTLGCGRDTLAYSVNAVNKVDKSPLFWRAVLMHAVRLGWMEKKQNPAGYSIFIIKAWGG